MAASCPTDPQAQKTLEEREVREGGEGRREGARPRTICQWQTEGRLSLRGFHAWMV